MNFQKNDSKPKAQSSPIDFIKTLAPYTIVILVTIILIVLLIAFQSEIRLVLTNNALNDFDTMIVSDGFHHISLADGRSWQLEYEKDPDQSFSGVVRHASPIHSGKFAILTHDILVTSGDFEDPSLVTTKVNNHHFSWKSITETHPAGSINLLHTLPMNQRIYQLLQQVENGEKVTIKGYEIYRIDGWDASGRYIGYWKDTGCNSILVTEVILK